MKWVMTGLLLCLLSMTATAQVGFSLYTSSTYDDNSFSFTEKREDVYHALFGALTAGTQQGSVYLQGYYYGAIVLFRTYSDRTYNVHTVGGYSQVQLDDPDGDAGVFSDSLVSYLFVIPQIGARFDHDNWDFYDFQRASLLLRLRRHVSGALMSTTHFTTQYKRYPNLEQFTHIELNGGVTLGYAVTGGVDVYGALDAGHKIYTESVSDTTWVQDGKPGKGKGSVKPPVPVVSRFSTPSTTQFVFSTGLVFKILPQAPLTISWLRRSNPSSDARYVSEDAFLGLSEDEIFDDRYGYQSNEFRLNLDGTLPGGIRTMNALEYQYKDYPRTATALTGVPLAGYPQRRDQRLVLRLQALYPFFRNDAGKGLSIGIAYNFIRNQSNNAYHDFHNHQVALVMSGDW
ncbi:MAG: hypothetical protein RRA94_01200 [Bacteroidota bacterium]|nr:hypothetical protein [Bacteroidota bacterium]